MKGRKIYLSRKILLDRYLSVYGNFFKENIYITSVYTSGTYIGTLTRRVPPYSHSFDKIWNLLRILQIKSLLNKLLGNLNVFFPKEGAQN